MDSKKTNMDKRVFPSLVFDGSYGSSASDLSGCSGDFVVGRQVAVVAQSQPPLASSDVSRCGGARGASMVHIPIQHDGKMIKRGLNGRSRRVFSRALLGTKKPGRYYFLTFTTIHSSPSIKRCWDSVRKYLKNLYPRTVHLHVLTSEGCDHRKVVKDALPGQGVIHMILRMGRGERRVEVVPLRKWWFEYTGAKQIKILKVENKKDLARYISDQRYKKKLAGEFAWQDGIVSWGYSAGWLPKGFGKHFGRFWQKSRDAELGQREMFLHDWLLRCYDNPDEMTCPPRVRSGRGLE